MLGSGLLNIPHNKYLWFSLSLSINQNTSPKPFPKITPWSKKPHSRMLNPFICGTFHHEEDVDEPWSSPSSTPRKSRKNNFCKRNNKDSKNPYSTRGLDKFSALLADLEEKKQQIYSQMGSQDISFVRFVYSNSDDCVPIPIVVKSKNKEQEKTKLQDIKKEPQTQSTATFDKFPVKSSATEQEVKQPILESDKKTVQKSFSWNMKLYRWRRPSYYLPVVIVLILLFLAVFGRSFSILCTSIVWYMLPILKNGSTNVKRPKKKDYVRRFSENKMVSDGLSSPKSNTNSGAVKDKSPRQRGHNNSW